MVTAASSPTTRTTASAEHVRAAIGGALFGMVASMVMATYAMIASATYQHHGFFTPLYHIASTFIAPDEMMTSMMQAMQGSTYTFACGPALVGALVHMMTGAMFGAAFAVMASAARIRGGVLIGAGAVWGAAVYAISAFVGLPIAASLFGGGDPIRNMAQMVGHGTFLVEHVLFGLALGALLATRRSTRQ